MQVLEEKKVSNFPFSLFFYFELPKGENRHSLLKSSNFIFFLYYSSFFLLENVPKQMLNGIVDKVQTFTVYLTKNKIHKLTNWKTESNFFFKKTK